MQSNDLPKSVRDLAQSLSADYQRQRSAERRSIESAGGPAEWLRRRAPALLPLFPGGLTNEQFFRETLDGWEDAAARMKECARCPAEGGACDNSQNAWPDGHVMAPDPEKGIRAEPCAKWASYGTWRKLAAGNVPLPYRTLRPLGELAHYEEAIEPGLAEARRSGSSCWYFVTGGDARQHKHALIALAFELGEIYKKPFWYDWSSRVAVGLREHMNNAQSVDLRDKLRTVPVLAMDHLNPDKWKERDPNRQTKYGWFADALDELLYARSGLTTIVASSRTADELAEAMPLTAALLDGAAQVVLG